MNLSSRVMTQRMSDIQTKADPLYTYGERAVFTSGLFVILNLLRISTIIYQTDQCPFLGRRRG